MTVPVSTFAQQLHGKAEFKEGIQITRMKLPIFWPLNITYFKNTLNIRNILREMIGWNEQLVLAALMQARMCKSS